jgi:hypothetical protein
VYTDLIFKIKYNTKYYLEHIFNVLEAAQDNLIDGTLIINKSGIENIGYGCGESLKKKSTSFTTGCNDNTKPIPIICNPNYTKITKK